jgi:hypothetical protein
MDSYGKHGLGFSGALSMASIRDVVKARGSLDGVRLPSEIDELLAALNIIEPAAAPFSGDFSGKVVPGRNLDLFGFGSFSVDPGLPPIDFELKTFPAPATGFRCDLTLGDRLKLPDALKPATVTVAGNKSSLTANGNGPVIITGVFAARIEGSSSNPATLRFVVPGSNAAVVTVQLKPPAVLFGDSGFGIDFTGGLVIDSSITEAPAPAVKPGPEVTPAWQGIAVRNAKFYFPDSVPLLSGRPLEIEFALGNPVGIDARCQAQLAADAGRPAVTANFEWHDPLASSLAMCLPTLIEAIVEFPVRGQAANLSDVGSPGVINIDGVEKLTVRGRFARDLRIAPPVLSFSLGFDRSGPDGLIAIHAEPGFGPAKVFVTAGALAVAFMADSVRHDAPSGDATGTTLHALLVAASGLSAILTKKGKLVVHGVEIEGASGPATKKLRLRVDYSVDVAVSVPQIGTLSIGIDPDVPMRVRYRNVAMEVDFESSGLDRFHLSYSGADFGVEDPGKWLVNSPGSLLDVLGTRSGHGSTWFEIDLRFALDLGPIKVSGATVRTTFDAGGSPSVSLRGLEARVEIPALVSGSGQASLQEKGFEAALSATLVPLQVGAIGFIGFEDAGDFQKILLGFAVDLPGPIPLLNTGLGIFGFQGVFGINCMPKPIPNDRDATDELLAWKPWTPGGMPASRGDLTIGLGASIGTVPDLGFAFSSKALVVVAVPDFAIRVSVEGRILSSPVKLAELNSPPPIGPRLLGAIAVDSSQMLIAIRGEFEIERLFKVLIPFGARFPFVGNDWYVHLGADGHGSPLRGPGPISVTVLPGLLNVGASAYLMIHGDGIDDFAGLKKNLGGFAIGFGFEWRQSLGFVIVRLDLHAGLAVGLATSPMMFLGHGELDGSLHLGPISLGVSAGVDMQVGPGSDLWAHIHVCGEVDLFFFSISGCADLDVGSLSTVVPDPTDWPLKRLCLTDRFYGDAIDGSSTRESAPIVWPDAIPILEFAHGPDCALADGPFLDKLTLELGGKRIWKGTFAGDGAFGSDDLKYTFSMTTLSLVEVNGAAENPAGDDLWASWQVPKHVSGDRPGARELALLTWQPHLWTKALPDGGKQLQPDPLGTIVNHCHIDLLPIPWWALGGEATRQGDAWDLPPEYSWNRKFASVFHATVTVEFGGRPLTAEGIYGLSLSAAFDLTSAVQFAASVVAAGREFLGALRLPSVLGRPELWDLDPAAEDLKITARIGFSTTVLQPAIAALVDPWNPQRRSMQVTGQALDGSDVPFRAEVAPGPGGQDIVVFRPEIENKFKGATIRYDARMRIDLLGVLGLTFEAQAAVSQSKKGAQAGSGDISAAAGALGGGESLLKPGTLYRIDVGQLAVGVRPGGTPKTFNGPARSFWFQTAPVPPPPAPSPNPRPLPSVADIYRIRALNSPPAKPRDLFDPAYLQRYVLGFTPRDRTQNWFCDDPVSGHFKVDYIAQFVKLYGRDLELQCRRTDTPPERPGLLQRFPAADLVKLTDPWRANASDRRLIERDVSPRGNCPLPGAGATLPGKPLLEPLGTYDLAIVFPTPGVEGSGNVIPGVVFTTSRWRNAGELLLGLGFVRSGQTAVPAFGDGDVAISQPALPAGEFVGDAQFEATMAGLGLSRWPLPPTNALRRLLSIGPVSPGVPAGRTSLLWTKTASGWRLVGALLEALEPIHRPARAPGEIARLSIVGISHAGVAFSTVVRDASGSRILFVSSSPISAESSLELIVDEQAIPVGAPNAVVRNSYFLSINSAPRFAEEIP